MTEELRQRRAQLLEQLREVERALAHESGAAMSGAAARASGADTAGDDRGPIGHGEQRFRTLFEYAPEAITILDVDTGRFVDVNENACRLFGLAREELLRVGPVDVSPELQPDGTPSLEAAASWVFESAKGKHAVFEWLHRDASGHEIPCEVRLVPLPHATRRWLRGSVIDISERKRGEAERERLARELVQAQKLQAIGQLTGGVAHDFNNLLTVMMGSVAMIARTPDDVGEVRANAEQAMAAAERAAALTQQLLAFARGQPLRPQTVSMNELLGRIEGLLRRTLGQAIEIETVPDAGLWSCEVDPTQLETAILNLAINARDAMPSGGRLTIATANARLDRNAAHEHGRVRPGEYVMLTVTDTGTGMDAQTLSQVFEPFFTTKDAGRGTGLGLSMVYGFVKQSGGHVEIDSELRAGTTVRILLPRTATLATGARRPFDADGAPRGDGELVLVVEDTELVRGLVVKGLESLGYATLEAADAETALESIRTVPAVALVLTDLSLGSGMSGSDLAHHARSVRAELPVLVMSGYASGAAAREDGSEPAAALLQKPFTHAELAGAVHAALGAGAGKP